MKSAVNWPASYSARKRVEQMQKELDSTMDQVPNEPVKISFYVKK